MATSYSGITSQPVTVILPSGAAATWDEYTATAQPSGVVFRFRLSPVIDTPDFVNLEATNWADQFNTKSNDPGVQSISTYQTIDAQNQIEDRLTVIVQSDSGNSTTVLDRPQGELQPGLPPGTLTTFDDAVEAAREKLNAIEALG